MCTCLWGWSAPMQPHTAPLVKCLSSVRTAVALATVHIAQHHWKDRKGHVSVFCKNCSSTRNSPHGTASLKGQNRSSVRLLSKLQQHWQQSTWHSFTERTEKVKCLSSGRTAVALAMVHIAQHHWKDRKGQVAKVSLSCVSIVGFLNPIPPWSRDSVFEFLKEIDINNKSWLIPFEKRFQF